MNGSKNYHVHVDLLVDWRYGRDILKGLLEANRASRWGWGITSSLWKQDEVWNLQKDQPEDAVIGIFHNEIPAKRWRDKGVRIINIAGVLEEPEGVHTVTVDNAQVGRMAAAHFTDRGFTSFAYISHRNTPASHLRRNGFIEGIGGVGELHTHFNLQLESLTEFLKSLTAPTAIFCFQDAEARSVVSVLDKLGRSVPEEFSVLGVNDDSIDSGLSPIPLSSIDIRPNVIGQRAAETLHSLFNGKEVPRRQLITPGELIVRQSSDIYAMKDAAVADLLRRIRLRACEGIRVRDVMRASDGSRRGMEMKFKRLLGRTIEGEIRRCRLEAAREMLLGSSKSIGEIAESCGFCNTPHFSRMFRDTYGVPPGSYRS